MTVLTRETYIELCRQGMSQREIAERLSLTRGQVSNFVQRNDLTTPQKIRRGLALNAILPLLRKDVGVTDIAAQTGYSKAYIGSIRLERFGKQPVKPALDPKPPKPPRPPVRLTGNAGHLAALWANYRLNGRRF